MNYKSIVFILLSLASFFYCSKAPERTVLFPVPLQADTVQQFGYQAEQRSFVFQTNASFTAASSAPSWCTAGQDPSVSHNQLVISVAENNTPDTRTATVTIGASGYEDVKMRVVQNGSKGSEWILVWSDEFDIDGFIDPAVWIKWTKGSRNLGGFAKGMTDNDLVYDVKNGNLILRTIVNPGLPDDDAPYLTGGLDSKNTFMFPDGRIEIRAKITPAIATWPAIWLLPRPWVDLPYGGEIDIVEYVNSDKFVYQTVHSPYHDIDKKTNPAQAGTPSIHVNDYNTYILEVRSDKVVFSINGSTSFTYPRLTQFPVENQFPFLHGYYLLLTMQINPPGDSRTPSGLPQEMYIDWVRFYEWK